MRVHAFSGLNKCLLLVSMLSSFLNLCSGDGWLSPLLPLVMELLGFSWHMVLHINHVPSIPCI